MHKQLELVLLPYAIQSDKFLYDFMAGSSRIVPEFRILRLTFHRKSVSKY